MGKTKMDKKVNRVARQLNRQLTEDVYGSRFQIRQIQKTKGLDNWPYYLYELVDNEQPERNKIIPWTSGFSISSEVEKPFLSFSCINSSSSKFDLLLCLLTKNHEQFSDTYNTNHTILH